MERNGLCVRDCTRCDALVASRRQIVNGVGRADAELLFVGEGPGANEDKEGEPFVGRSGSVLDEALADAGVSRETVRITNCVRCRPPDNRDPHSEELSNCREFLEREINAVDPTVLVTLGKVPSEHLLGRSVAITSESGTVVERRLGGQSRRVMLSMHPAATLYDRSQREGFVSTIASAIELAGLDGAQRGSEAGGNDQSRLGEF